MGTDVVKNVNKNNASHAVLFEALALVSMKFNERFVFTLDTASSVARMKDGFTILYVLFHDISDCSIVQQDFCLMMHLSVSLSQFFVHLDFRDHVAVKKNVN